MSYTINQIVYEVGINIFNLQAIVAEQKILCIGEKSLFVSGIDSVWGHQSETTLYLSLKENFDPSKVFSTNTHTVWTDSREIAENIANEINDILKLRSKFSKTA